MWRVETEKKNAMPGGPGLTAADHILWTQRRGSFGAFPQWKWVKQAAEFLINWVVEEIPGLLMVIIPYHECVHFHILRVHDNTFSPSRRCALPLNKPYEVFWHFSTGDGKTTACFLVRFTTFVGILVFLGVWLGHTSKYHTDNGGFYCSLKRSSTHHIGCSVFFLWVGRLTVISIQWLLCQDPQGGDQCPFAAVWWLLSACRCECAAAQGGDPMSRFSWEAMVIVRELYKTHPKAKTVMVSFKVFFLGKWNHRNLMEPLFNDFFVPFASFLFFGCASCSFRFPRWDFQVPLCFSQGVPLGKMISTSAAALPARTFARSNAHLPKTPRAVTRFRRCEDKVGHMCPWNDHSFF